MSENEVQVKDITKRRPSKTLTKIPKQILSGSNKDTNEYEIENEEDFLPKGAFLLSTTFDVSLERMAAICEKLPLKGCFTLTKTATGILFKFADLEDYQSVLKMSFHRVTGARYYRKIQIPCRPKRIFTIFILEVPDELPIEDIRQGMFKFTSVIEVVRLQITKPSVKAIPLTKSDETLSTKSEGSEKQDRFELKEPPQSVIRVTLGSLDEFNILLQNGFNFYDATFFPTDANLSLKGAKIEYKQSIMDSSLMSGRVRNLLPIYDRGYPKYSTARKVVKTPTS